MSDKPSYLKGRIQLGDKSVARMYVVYADGRELSVLIKGAVELPEKTRCAFKHDGTTVEVLVRVEDTRQRDDETGAALTVLRSYSKAGRTHLESFLESVLSLTQFSPDQFVENTKGAYCTLDPAELSRARGAQRPSTPPDGPQARATGAGDAPVAPPVSAGDDVERRWQHRVRHILDACIERGQDTIEVLIFEVSSRGVRLSMPAEELPKLDLNGPVRLYVAFPTGRLTMRSRCICRIAWWKAPEAGEDDVTLGLELVEVLDGVHGQHWERFITAVSETSPVIASGQHGKPRQDT